MREYLPLLIVGAIIGSFAAIFIIAYAGIKNKKEAIGFDRNVPDSEIIRRLSKYALPYWRSFLLVLLTKPDPAARLRALMVALILGEALTVLIVTVLRRCRYRGQDLFLLPAVRDERVLDVSIAPDLEQTARVPREIIAFCQSCGVDREKANLIAVAAEEMAVNIIRYGGRHVHSIDIDLSITQESLILRLRDNGIPFDPTHYEADQDAFEIHGIEVVKRISDKVQYLRVLDLNNTTVEVALTAPEAQDG